jgi:tetratricopeptide (TPR) repeat protein
MAFHFRFSALLAAGLAVSLACGACSKDGAASAEGDVKDIVNQAWTAYRLNEFHDAIRHFEAARAAAEVGSDDWAMATYGLGIVWDLQRPGEDPAKATKLFNEAMEKAPDSPIAPWVELALVRQKHLVPVGKEPDYDAVKAGFQHIIDTYPGHLAAKEAFLYLEGIRLSELAPESSRVAESNLLAFVEREDHEFVSPAWSLLTVAYVTMDEQEKRLHAEEESFANVEKDPLDPSVEYAWAYWNLGTIAEFEVGDFDLARKYYKELLKEYPNDIRVHGCKQALKRMDDMEARIRAELAAEAAEAPAVPAEKIAAPEPTPADNEPPAPPKPAKKRAKKTAAAPQED